MNACVGPEKGQFHNECAAVLSLRRLPCSGCVAIMEIAKTGCVATMKTAELAWLLPQRSGKHFRSRLALGDSAFGCWPDHAGGHCMNTLRVGWCKEACWDSFFNVGWSSLFVEADAVESTDCLALQMPVFYMLPDSREWANGEIGASVLRADWLGGWSLEN